MHGQQNIKICNAEQAKHLYRYKNIKTKLYKRNAAIWYNKTCRVLSQRPHDKDICRGGEYHRLPVQFRPPDDGPVRPETCREKKIADIVRRQKSSVSSWK